MPDQPTPPDLGYRWWIAVRNAPGLKHQIPPEATLSYPVLAAGELRFFHYRVMNGQLTRPFTRIRAAVPSMRLIEVMVSKHRELYPDLPYDLGPNTAQWNLELEKDLLNLVPRLVERFTNQPAGALGQQYREAFDLLTPAALRLFYEALNPAFFVWLNGES